MSHGCFHLLIEETFEVDITNTKTLLNEERMQIISQKGIIVSVLSCSPLVKLFNLLFLNVPSIPVNVWFVTLIWIFLVNKCYTYYGICEYYYCCLIVLLWDHSLLIWKGIEPINSSLIWYHIQKFDFCYIR